jgi:co-chaperonin GroES (HSP10)|uniref:Co-chaperonin GroES n=1 Tax=uncultured virus TaxID=340016 RepID=A0A221S369_9VIRU|nr:co-chaperonin GroES [uncultured virus]
MTKTDINIADKESNFIVPKTKEEKEEYINSLPDPSGYRLLIRPFAGAQKTKGGILLADTTIETIQATTVVGLVIKMGNLCYRDKEKFPLGPWCRVGEFIMYGRYAGSRFKNKWGEHRILNDDEIIGVIKDPEDIKHMF